MKALWNASKPENFYISHRCQRILAGFYLAITVSVIRKQLTGSKTHSARRPFFSQRLSRKGELLAVSLIKTSGTWGSLAYNLAERYPSPLDAAYDTFLCGYQTRCRSLLTVRWPESPVPDSNADELVSLFDWPSSPLHLQQPRQQPLQLQLQLQLSTSLNRMLQWSRKNFWWHLAKTRNEVELKSIYSSIDIATSAGFPLDWHANWLHLVYIWRYIYTILGPITRAA